MAIAHKAPRRKNRGEKFAPQLAFPFFRPRCQRQLRDQFGPIEVINAAVMGYTPYNELHYYLTEGRKFGADVVLVAFCMNDVANPRLHWGDAPGVTFPPEAIPNHDYDRDRILPRVRKLEEEKARPPLLKRSRLYGVMEKGVGRIFRRNARNFADTGFRIPTFITGEDTLSIEVLLDEIPRSGAGSLQSMSACTKQSARTGHGWRLPSSRSPTSWTKVIPSSRRNGSAIIAAKTPSRASICFRPSGNTRRRACSSLAKRAATTFGTSPVPGTS